MTHPHIMYGSPVSLYSGKLRSYLRKKALPFEERLPAHPAFARDIVPAVGRVVLPVLVAPEGDVLQDTTEIIDVLEDRHPEPALVPRDPALKTVARILELYGDEGLLRPAMHYRWNFPDANDHFISLEFARMGAPATPDDQADTVAAPLKARMSGLLPYLGITADTIPGIEGRYHELLGLLDRHFADHPYLLGLRPTIADFGFIGPLYAHLGRDPHPAALMQRQAHRVWRWVERMMAPEWTAPEFPEHTFAGPAPSASSSPSSGQAYGEDGLFRPAALPETLKDLLKMMSREHAPELAACVAFLDDHVRTTHPTDGAAVLGDSGKRTLGRIRFHIDGTPYEAAVRQYAVWMLNRAQDSLAALPEKERAALSRILEETGLSDLLGKCPPWRIERHAYREIWHILS